MLTDPAVMVPAGRVSLTADLVVPDGATAAVLFAHGSGSSRHSPRNRAVAGRLHEHGFGTVLADLLTAEEEQRDADTGALRFDIGLLTARVEAMVEWAANTRFFRDLPVGLFGASTGAAAALVAAADLPDRVRAVVSRGGRPDLAGEALARVRAPTLLLVGERDAQVRVLNQEAAGRLAGPHRLDVIANATHLFPEPGALAQVAEHAAEWFHSYLVRSSARA